LVCISFNNWNARSRHRKAPTPPVSLWMPFLGSSHRVSFRVVSCHAGSPVRSKLKLKQCKQARMRYTAGVQSLAQLFEAVSLHQLLVGGSRYFVVRTFVCLLFAQLCFSFWTLSAFLRLYFYITLSFLPFFTSAFFPPFISCHLLSLIATLSSIYITFLVYPLFVSLFLPFQILFPSTFFQFFSLFLCSFHFVLFFFPSIFKFVSPLLSFSFFIT